MKNKRGYTVQERIKQDIEHAKKINDRAKKAMLATKALGAADLAVEFGLISFKQWEHYINVIFKLL